MHFLVHTEERYPEVKFYGEQAFSRKNPFGGEKGELYNDHVQIRKIFFIFMNCNICQVHLSLIYFFQSSKGIFCLFA